MQIKEHWLEIHWLLLDYLADCGKIGWVAQNGGDGRGWIVSAFFFIDGAQTFDEVGVETFEERGRRFSLEGHD